MVWENNALWHIDGAEDHTYFLWSTAPSSSQKAVFFWTSHFFIKAEPHPKGEAPLVCLLPPLTLFFWGGAGTWFWQVPALTSSSLCCGIVSQKFDPLLLPPADDPFTKCIAIHACAVGSWLWSLKASLTVSLSQDGGASTRELLQKLAQVRRPLDAWTGRCPNSKSQQLQWL